VSRAKELQTLQTFRFCFNPSHHRLPDYAAAVEALEYIERRLRPMDPPHHDGQEGRRWADVNDAYTMAVGALALLRDEVPA
jgi:hypothetical protein